MSNTLYYTYVITFFVSHNFSSQFKFDNNFDRN